jgi:hypothetical protein
MLLRACVTTHCSFGSVGHEEHNEEHCLLFVISPSQARVNFVYSLFGHDRHSYRHYLNTNTYSKKKQHSQTKKNISCTISLVTPHCFAASCIISDSMREMLPLQVDWHRQKGTPKPRPRPTFFLNTSRGVS